ncbi:MAG: hypothetical protein AB8B53_07885 [Flavobacteriales bacterium]
MEDNSLVLARRFSCVQEAHLFATRLENSGVKAYIDGDLIGSSYIPLMDNVSGISVRILKTDLDKAKSIFEEEDMMITSHLTKPFLRVNDKYYLPFNGMCVRCGSSDVYSRGSLWLSKLARLITLGYIKKVRSVFSYIDYCNSCNQQWNSMTRDN